MAEALTELALINIIFAQGCAADSVFIESLADSLNLAQPGDVTEVLIID